jgi:hypothetical protein
MLMPLAMAAMLPTIDMDPVYDESVEGIMTRITRCPLQLVTSGEKRPARWVRNLAAIHLKTAE